MFGAENKEDHLDLTGDLNSTANGSAIPMLLRILMAFAGNVIPWGSMAPWGSALIGGAVSIWSESEQSSFNKVAAALFKQQEKQIGEIAKTIEEVMARVDQTDQKTQDRLQSPEYLAHFQKVFRKWSSIDTENKRKCIRNLLVNAAGNNICGDDVIQTFIDWIEKYGDAHFKVISEIFQHPGATRSEIWDAIHGTIVRDDSAEADYFKNLISDLSIGRVIRQARETDQIGRFMKSSTRGKRTIGTPFVISAFDDKKPYVLTELGKQFVHYTMNEIVPKIAHQPQGDSSISQ